MRENQLGGVGTHDASGEGPVDRIVLRETKSPL